MTQPPDQAGPPGTPRWVKAFGIIALIVVVLVVLMLLLGGEHGPGRHLPSGGLGSRIALIAGVCRL